MTDSPTATTSEMEEIRELAGKLLETLDEHAGPDHRLVLASVVDVLAVALGAIQCRECRQASAKHLKRTIPTRLRDAMAVAEQQPEHEGSHVH